MPESTELASSVVFWFPIIDCLTNPDFRYGSILNEESLFIVSELALDPLPAKTSIT